MTIRIRELVIRAEIGGHAEANVYRSKKSSHPVKASKSDAGIMTRRFYEREIFKDNER